MLNDMAPENLPRGRGTTKTEIPRFGVSTTTAEVARGSHRRIARSATPDLTAVRAEIDAEAKPKATKTIGGTTESEEPKIHANATKLDPAWAEGMLPEFGINLAGFRKFTRRIGGGIAEVSKRIGSRGAEVRNRTEEAVNQVRAEHGGILEWVVVKLYEAELEGTRWMTQKTKQAIDTTRGIGEYYFNFISLPSRAWETLGPVMWWKENSSRRWETANINHLQPPERRQLALDLFARREGLRDWNPDDLGTLNDKWDDPRALLGVNMATARLAWRKDTIINITDALNAIKKEAPILGVARAKREGGVIINGVLDEQEQLARFYQLMNLMNVTDATFLVRRISRKRLSWKVTDDGEAFLISKGADTPVRPSLAYLDQTPIEAIRLSPGKAGGWTLNIFNFDQSVSDAGSYILTHSRSGGSRAPVPG